MVDISSGDKKISINVSSVNNKTNANIISVGNKASVNATPDMAMYYSNKSREWAISEGVVSGEDNSSKWYANKSKQYKEATENLINDFDKTVADGITEINTAGGNIIEDIQNAGLTNYNLVSDAGTTALNEISTAQNTAVSTVQTEGNAQYNRIISTGIENKQDKLTAGTGIDITNNVISNTQTSAEWGNIEGNIEEQTDLADYIKENSASGLQLFDLVLKDHILSYEESEGLALQGTYVYKEPVAGSRYGYPDFYAKCLEEMEFGTETETTLGGTTFNAYVNPNGHVFYDIEDKSIIDAFYQNYGACWMYGVDTVNERIFLPRNDWFFQSASANAGAYVLYICVGSSVNVKYTTVELASETALAPLNFDTETGALQLSIGEGLKKDIDSNLAIDKGHILGLCIPDYSAGISVSSNPFVVPANGIMHTTCQNGGVSTVNLTRNGVTVRIFNTGTYANDVFSYTYPVLKGDSLQYTNALSGNHLEKFYPYRGGQ